MTAVKSPCLNCEKRQIGCHGSCADYKQYAQALKDAKQAAYDANAVMYYYGHKDRVLKEAERRRKK